MMNLTKVKIDSYIQLKHAYVPHTPAEDYTPYYWIIKTPLDPC